MLLVPEWYITDMQIKLVTSFFVILTVAIDMGWSLFFLGTGVSSTIYPSNAEASVLARI